jgi:peroxiredoxin
MSFTSSQASTPGCTKESCGFSENIAAFETLEATVLGATPYTMKAKKPLREIQSRFALLTIPAWKC